MRIKGRVQKCVRKDFVNELYFALLLNRKASSGHANIALLRRTTYGNAGTDGLNGKVKLGKKMDEEELKKEVEKIIAEEEGAKHHRKAHHLRWHPRLPHPASIVIGLVLILLIVMMVVPWYGVTLDPEPKNVPGKEVMPKSLLEQVDKNKTLSSESKANFKKLMMPEHAALRLMASRIALQSCDTGKICHAKAIFYWVRDNFEYVSDPPNGYLETPFETMYMGGGDCDGLAILLVNLLQGVGVDTRLAFIPGHVYVQVKIDTAPRKYKEKDGWITLDPTCKQCDFGEIPYSTWNQQKKDYLYV